VARSDPVVLPESGPATQATALDPLREPSYRRYFIGNVASNLGTFCQAIAQSLLVYNLTGSTFLVGVVNFAQFAALLVLVPWTGAAADRFDRKRLIITTQVAAGVVTGVLTILSAIGWATTPVVIVCAAMLGVTAAFAVPAFRSMLPQIVSERNLGRAVNLDSVAVNVARALGPVGGATLVAAAGATWAFGINSLSYFLLCIALAGVHPVSEKKAAGAPRFRDGLRSVRARPALAAMLFIVAACGIAADPPSTLGPEVASSFGGGDALAGFILGGFGAGAVLAAFLAGAEAARHHRRVAMLLGILVAGLVAFAVSPWLALTLLGSVTAGFGYLAAQTRTSSMMYRHAGPHERGRIMALWSMAFIGVRPIASLLDGAIASLAGTTAATLVMTAPAAVAMLLSIVLARRDAATSSSSAPG
jgi:MFS family permease